MSRDNKRRKKHERRQRRIEKKARQQARRDERLAAETCPNCGDRFGVADDPEVIHRAGPCDCTPEIRKVMDDFLEARELAFEEAPGGVIACKTCGTTHNEDAQSTHFFEGRLVWDGCDGCFENQAAKFELIREDHRERWFGKRLAQAGIVVRPITEGKYVPFCQVPVKQPDGSEKPCGKTLDIESSVIARNSHGRYYLRSEASGDGMSFGCHPGA